MEIRTVELEIADLDDFLETVDSVATAHDVTVQAFDARYVAGRQHLERAVELADRAIARGENVARDRSVEILLYAAGRRQIDRALEMGVSAGETRAVFVIDGTGDEAAAATALRERLDGDGWKSLERSATGTSGDHFEWRDSATIESFFDITEAERAATDADLETLVCERVALLEVEK
ncbi:KEOPS complex subunit Cgi121 [Halobacteria archaeon AArc-curdl1]|uniref:KEOPS complex subunit Cgi121 n=1 Tax=Natronosalvus hydrolyticus TaxID=2979988 RepID=A0AAP2Z9S1_9EURY|nr:KEOPS complex subunit Cgi121 [Halobacteria archaeon AArc-curdl1]